MSKDRWTRDRIEARLVAAFRASPGVNVFSDQGRFRPTQGAAVDTDALSWARMYVPDDKERLALMAWARCQAEGKSARALFDEMGWKRNTAERRRQRALRIIATQLNSM